MCSVSWAIPWWKHLKTATVKEQLFFESLSSIIIIKACNFPVIHPRMIFPFFSPKDKFPENLYSIHQPVPNSHLCSSNCTSWGSLNAHFLGWPRWSTRSPTGNCDPKRTTPWLRPFIAARRPVGRLKCQSFRGNICWKETLHTFRLLHQIQANSNKNSYVDFIFQF